MPNINGPSYQGYMPSFDDERRITDIVRNKNPVSPTSDPFGINNAKVDNYNDRIHPNRKPAFGQRTHSDPKYSHPNFRGSSFQNPFTGINHLNFGSDLDNELYSYKAFAVHNEPFEVYSRPIFVYDGASKNGSPADFGFRNNHDTTKHRVANHPLAGNYDFHKVSSRPITENNGARISNGGFKDTSKLWNPELLTMFRGFGTKITGKPRREYLNSISLVTDHLFLCQRSSRCTQYARVNA